MLKKLFPMAVLATILGLPVSAMAQTPTQEEGLKLARSSNCLACHQVDKKRVGPAFNVVAERFAGQDGAAAHLAQSISKGSRGQWGPVPMPAQPQLSPANSLVLANWILSLSAQD